MKVLLHFCTAMSSPNIRTLFGGALSTMCRLNISSINNESFNFDRRFLVLKIHLNVYFHNDMILTSGSEGPPAYIT
jgi:hypothetical protein